MNDDGIFFKLKSAVVKKFGWNKAYDDRIEYEKRELCNFLLYAPSKCIDKRAFEQRICCKDFLQAIEKGSDGYKDYPAITTTDDGQYLIGTVYNELQNCPWCGEKL